MEIIFLKPDQSIYIENKPDGLSCHIAFRGIISGVDSIPGKQLTYDNTMVGVRHNINSNIFQNVIIEEKGPKHCSTKTYGMKYLLDWTLLHNFGYQINKIYSKIDKIINYQYNHDYPDDELYGTEVYVIEFDLQISEYYTITLSPETLDYTHLRIANNTCKNNIEILKKSINILD